MLAASLLGHSAAAAEETRATVFVLPDQSLPAGVVGKVSTRLRLALRKNPRLSIKDWNKLLGEFSGEVPSDALREATQSRFQGLGLLDAGELTAAIEKLREAAVRQEAVLAFIKKQDLAETYLALAVAQAKAGDRTAALKTLISVLTWRPTLRYDQARFGSEHLALFERARRKVKRLKRGSVELTTEPPGARAYVDGRFVGVTPTVAFGLPVGQHFATFKIPGYLKAAQVIEVSPRMQRSYAQPLRRNEKYLLLQQALKQAKLGLGAETANSGMIDMRNILFVDQVVFAELRPSGERLSLKAHLYDLRSKLRLNQASQAFGGNQLKKVDELAELLYLNVRYDGTIEAPPEPPPPPKQERSPFYARWWFWTAIAAGAAAVTLTVIYWPTDDSCQGNAPSDQRCVLFGN